MFLRNFSTFIAAFCLASSFAVGENIAFLPDCAQGFSSLGRLSDKVLAAIPDRHREAVLAALEKQYSLIVDGLTEAEKKQIASTLRNFQHSDGVIGVTPDGSNFQVPDRVLDLPLSGFIVIHEAQHLRDIVKPPTSLARAKSFTKKVETRAYLRQRALLLDIFERIGLDGITDIVMQGARLRDEQRNTLRKAIAQLVEKPRAGETDPYAVFKRALSDFDGAGAEELGMPFTHLNSLKDRHAYIQHFLDSEAYIFQIAREEDPEFVKKLETYEKILRQNEEKIRRHQMLMDASMALTGILGSINAYLVYQAFFSTKDPKRSK